MNFDVIFQMMLLANITMLPLTLIIYVYPVKLLHALVLKDIIWWKQYQFKWNFSNDFGDIANVPLHLISGETPFKMLNTSA
jgi:hypothetical protein